ncbi:MAG TPA: FAD-dependent oxidoreductase [Polyangiaceae bacterium]|nr:FAD-dependent oxidoreductase [Polyangiaceae bacterium]
MTAGRVVVIGAGMAGTAAAFAAARAGAAVVVVHDRAGASALYSGALDLVAWDAEVSAAVATRTQAALADAGLAAFLTALGVHRLGGTAPNGLIATASGVVRPALGADHALLELAPLAGRRVAVADVERDDWDAPLLAKTLGASDWAERTGTTFTPISVRLLRTGYERRIAPYDFAELHDDPARGAALADALNAAGPDADAWLVGPWLGVEPDTVAAIRSRARAPLGETTSPLAGAAGARFERARDRLFMQLGVEVRRGRVGRIAAHGAGWAVELASEVEGTPSELSAAAVVLATGGVGAGGVVFTWRLPGVVRGFELPFAAPVTLALDGEPAAGGGSLYGPSLETKGLGVLERVGIACDALGRPVGNHDPQTGLFVAGDAVAGRPRTMLEAALAGLASGNVAARE